MAETTTLTLADFLLARISEDEAWARDPDTVDGWNEWNPGDPNDPARVLAECEAKRRIVDLLTDGTRVVWERMAAANRDVLAYLAIPYADHPDCSEEWRP